MPYFQADFLNFFRELEENNTKEWFNANKKRYEKEVKKPFEKLVGDLIGRISKEDPEVRIAPKDAIFRINRDIRFSADKSPYKTHVGANLSHQGRKSMDSGFYLQLGADKVLAGGGAYMLDKEPLYNVRNAIANAPDRFQKVLDNKDFKSKYKTFLGEQNKVLPKEFKDVAQQQPLIANKQFYYMADLPADSVLRDDFLDVVMDYYRAGGEANRFLNEAMKG